MLLEWSEGFGRRFGNIFRPLLWMDKRPLPFPGFGTLPKVSLVGHRCEGELPVATYGKAISYCYEDADGKLWITNEEYASQVNFCPYCGFKAKVEVKET